MELIRLIRPDIYAKGGDYDIKSLEETRIVRSWGGQAVAIPFVDGFSTTALVHRIRHPLQQPNNVMRKAAFLDRDGVINKDNFYVHRWEDFEFFRGAIQGMHRLQDAGFALVIITNQSGLARGYFNQAQYQSLTSALREELSRQGIKLDGVYHCPHHPKGTVPELAVECDCRKPAPGMLLQATRELNLSLTDSLLIGDKPSDIEAARAAGVGRAYLIQSENPEPGTAHTMFDGYFASLLDCIQYLFPANSLENRT